MVSLKTSHFSRVIKILLFISLSAVILYLPASYLITITIAVALNSGSVDYFSVNNAKMLSENFIYFYVIFACIIMVTQIFKERLGLLLRKIIQIKTATILLLALILRVLWVALFVNPPASDYVLYNNLALEFAKTGSFTFPMIPLYPVGSIFTFAMIYKLFGSHLLLVKVFHIVLSLATIILFYKVADELFGKYVAKIFLFLYSFYPAHIAMITITSPEVIMTFLFSIFIYVYLVSRQYTGMHIVLGMLGGLLLYVKQIFLLTLFVPLIYNLILKNYNNILRSLLIPIIALLIVLPFSLSYGNLFLVSTTGGINILIGNNKEATGSYISPLLIEEYNVIHENEPMSTFEWDRQCRKIAAEFIIRNPKKFILLIPKKLFWVFFKDTSALTLCFMPLHLNNSIKLILYVFNSIYYYLIILGAIFSLRLSYIKNNFKQYLLLISFIVSILLVFTLFFGIDRFKYPIMPLIIILTSLSICGQKNILPKSANKKLY